MVETVTAVSCGEDSGEEYSRPEAAHGVVEAVVGVVVRRGDNGAPVSAVPIRRILTEEEAPGGYPYPLPFAFLLADGFAASAFNKKRGRRS